jgi:putative Ca2+/H+ antiporter (TMEM165/GDT1 family)
LDWQGGLSAFGLLLVMELGDKTQLLVMALTARTSRGGAVFLGGFLALATITLAAVVLGSVAGELVPVRWLSRVAGAAFLVIGGLMLWSSRPGTGKEDSKEERRSQTQPRGRGALGTLATSFGLLLAAEMGDKSQLAVLGLTVKTRSPVAVFVGATLALALLTLLSVLAGKLLARWVPERWVSLAGGVLFLVMGGLVLAGVF